MLTHHSSNTYEEQAAAAIGQAAERVGLPMAYVGHLQGEGDWGQALLAHNFRELYHHDPGKYHLGRRLDDNLDFSQATYDLDTKTMASAMGDVVKGSLGPAKVDEFCQVIRRADAEKVDPKKVPELLKARGLSKGETDKVKEAFVSADVENMPAGQSTWRLSNAISWVAGQTEDKERALDLMKAAGAVLPGGETAAQKKKAA